MKKRFVKNSISFIEVESYDYSFVSPLISNVYVCFVRDCVKTVNGDVFQRDCVVFDFDSLAELNNFCKYLCEFLVFLGYSL